MHPAELLLHTVCFRPQLESDTLARAWNESEPSGLRDLIALEDAALWLHHRVRQIEKDSGLIVLPPDRDLALWIVAEARRTSATNLMVDAHTTAVSSLLDELGVPHILLKGAARLRLTDDFPLGAARRTNDVDVLIPAGQAERVAGELKRRGYEYQFPPNMTPPDHYHVRPLVDAAGVPVELHVSTSEAVDAEEAWRRTAAGAVTVDRDGSKTRVPSATELLWHGTTHALSHGPRAFLLRFFLDAASILAVDAEIDWAMLDHRLDTAEVPGRRRAVAWLGAAAWLAGTDLPNEIARNVVPFPLHRVMRWRLEALRRRWTGKRITEKLLDEGTRAEAGMPLTPSVPGKPLRIRLRRRGAAVVARSAYLTWRIGQGDVTTS